MSSHASEGQQPARRPPPAKALATGNAPIDLEMTVASRAMERLRRTLASDLAALIDVDIAEHALMRIAAAIRSLGNSRSSSAAANGEANHSRGLRTSALPMHDQYADLGGDSEAPRSREGVEALEVPSGPDRLSSLWGTVAAIAAPLPDNRRGTVLLALNPDELRGDRADQLRAEGRRWGFAGIAEALLRRARPVLLVHVIAPPAAETAQQGATGAVPPELSSPTPLEGLNVHPRLAPPLLWQGDDVPLPPGIVACAAEHGVPVQASSAASSSVRGGAAAAAAAAAATASAAPAILSRRLPSFRTCDHEGSWIAVDFGSARVFVTAYGFASVHPILPGYFPRCWVLEGAAEATDGAEWIELCAHRNDDCFAGKVPVRAWAVSAEAAAGRPGRGGGFRFLRLRMTGANSFGSHELQASSLEFYGTLVHVETREATPLSGTAGASARSRPPGFAPVSPLPELGATKSKGAAKKK